MPQVQNMQEKALTKKQQIQTTNQIFVRHFYADFYVCLTLNFFVFFFLYGLMPTSLNTLFIMHIYVKFEDVIVEKRLVMRKVTWSLRMRNVNMFNFRLKIKQVILGTWLFGKRSVVIVFNHRHIITNYTFSKRMSGVFDLLNLQQLFAQLGLKEGNYNMSMYTGYSM